MNRAHEAGLADYLIPEVRAQSLVVDSVKSLDCRSCVKYEDGTFLLQEVKEDIKTVTVTLEDTLRMRAGRNEVKTPFAVFSTENMWGNPGEIQRVFLSFSASTHSNNSSVIGFEICAAPDLPQNISPQELAEDMLLPLAKYTAEELSMIPKEKEGIFTIDITDKLQECIKRDMRSIVFKPTQQSQEQDLANPPRPARGRPPEQIQIGREMQIFFAEKITDIKNYVPRDAKGES